MCHSVDQNRSLHAQTEKKKICAIVLTKTDHYMPQVPGQVAQSDARSTGRGFNPPVQPFVEHFQCGHEGPMLYCYVLADLKIKFTYLLTNYSTSIIPYRLMQAG